MRHYVILIITCFSLLSAKAQVTKQSLIGTWELVAITETADTNLVYLLTKDAQINGRFKEHKLRDVTFVAADDTSIIDLQSIMFAKGEINRYWKFTKDSIFDQGHGEDSTFQNNIGEYDSSYLEEFPLKNRLYSIAERGDSLTINYRTPGAGYWDNLWFYNVKMEGALLRTEELNYAGMIRYFRKRNDAGF